MCEQLVSRMKKKGMLRQMYKAVAVVRFVQ